MFELTHLCPYCDYAAFLQFLLAETALQSADEGDLPKMLVFFAYELAEYPTDTASSEVAHRGREFGEGSPVFRYCVEVIVVQATDIIQCFGAHGVKVLLQVVLSYW